jgi:methyl-accepting chemotaxis protein
MDRANQSAELQSRLSAEVEMKRRLDERTGELARQAGSVSSEMEDIGAAVNRLASSAHGIGRSVSEATQVAAEATNEARATAQVIAELRESRGKIEEILEVIHSIAGKTNLLALNATIEAARAGAVGKGFAVVAGEVKDLAGQTSRAVADIAATLEGIGNGTEAAVVAIDRITAVVTHIGNLQDSIADAVEDQRVSSDEISRTVTAASEEVARVLGGMKELARV